ncbi:MAG: Ribosomal family, partial [Pseudonocardiales bacterium]|nr:Ribosomal family [Pseudonocardiales bacterium]
NPNVQTVRAMVAPGTRRRITVCTSCLKAGKVTRA